MQEVEPDEKWIGGDTEPTPEETTGRAPSETELVIVSLLMRIYDIQMALLSNVNPKVADEIFDKHAEGGHFNPNIYIPEVTNG